MSILHTLFLLWIDDAGKGSSTTTTGRAPTAEETELINKQIELADFQLQQLQSEAERQQTVFDEASGLIGKQQDEVERQTALARELEPIQKELLQRQLEQIRSGGAATPEQVALIDQATEAALESGQSDIERFQTTATERLREELAPSLGLRPGDTPILDRGARIAEEATRQFGQLTSNLRGANATARLNFPLAAGSFTSGLSQFQQGLADAQQQFSQQLRESAALNRLNLSGAKTSAGLNLATGVPSNISGALSALSNIRGTTSTTSGGGFNPIAAIGATGGFLQGLGAVGVNLSDRRMKKDVERIGTLPNGIPIYEYHFIWDEDDSEKIWGVMADELAEVIPEAVTEEDGYLKVDYSMVPMRGLQLEGA